MILKVVHYPGTPHTLAPTEDTGQHFALVVDSVEEQVLLERIHHAFVAVYQLTLNRILTLAPPPEEFDANGRGFVTLISHDESEGNFSIGVSYLVPRAYTLLDECGWDNIVPEDGVACP